MKRKLNTQDIPEGALPSEAQQTSTNSFESLNLDTRLLQAIQHQKFSIPTAIQSRVIPLALAGSSVLARSKTGSGKTAAYLLPILQAILTHHKSTANAA